MLHLLRVSMMEQPLMGADAIQAGIQAGNINVSDAGREMMDLTEDSLVAQERHAQMLAKLEAERRARAVVVPTADEDVRAMLRSLGHPVCLFGEQAVDRRERLRLIVARREVEGEESVMVERIAQRQAVDAAASAPGEQGAQAGVEEKQKEKFYTPASAELRAARGWIAAYSFRRAEERLSKQRELTTNLDLFNKGEAEAAELHEHVQHVRNTASQVGDDRPLSCCRFAPDGVRVATSSWGGVVKVWRSNTFEVQALLRGHKERVVSVAWRPAGAESGGKAANAELASAGADGVAMVWPGTLRAGETSLGGEGMDVDAAEQSVDNAAGGGAGGAEGGAGGGNGAPQVTQHIRPLLTLRGHVGRLSAVVWHPSGRLVGTTGYDCTWRLWDVERGGAQLVMQEGHARPTYGLAFHPDGSLVATGDLSGVGRLWDLRSGRSIMTLQGHRGILSLDFAPNGYLLASGSDDHTAKVWDLRRRKCMYTLPAHSGLVSCVRFSPATGEFLLTSSFDATCKLWSTRDFSLRATLAGHEQRVTSCDIAPDEKHIVTASYDKTWKYWAHKDEF